MSASQPLAAGADAGHGHNVLLCVCGGIAAYKAVEVLRGLQKAGCDVRVCLTADAERFVGRATFEGLCKHPVATDEYTFPESFIPHIDLSAWADAVLVVPATGNVMAKMAAGIADDMVTTTLLAVPEQTPVLVAAAMNVRMWKNAATQQNLRTLVARGVEFVMPVEGMLACGDVGEGKLAPVDEIVDAVLRRLECAVAGDLAGLSVLVTAGPTQEAIDPVRYIANRSSGKMGYAVAAEAARRGANVTLVSGPVSLAAPRGVRVVQVVSAADMAAAVTSAFPGMDVAICAAAVADYTPAHPADHKLKKAHEHIDCIQLRETQDILATLSAQKGDRVVVGFAAETNDLLQNARAKLVHKGCDLIVANDVSRSDSGFGVDTDRVSFVTAAGVEKMDTMPKADVARELLDRVVRILAQRREAAPSGEEE